MLWAYFLTGNPLLPGEKKEKRPSIFRTGRRWGNGKRPEQKKRRSGFMFAGRIDRPSPRSAAGGGGGLFTAPAGRAGGNSILRLLVGHPRRPAAKQTRLCSGDTCRSKLIAASRVADGKGLGVLGHVGTADVAVVLHDGRCKGPRAGLSRLQSNSAQLGPELFLRPPPAGLLHYAKWIVRANRMAIWDTARRSYQ